MEIFAEGFTKLANEISQRFVAPSNSTMCELPQSLDKIIGCCYAASLHTEEGEPTQFSVICADSDFAKRVDDRVGWASEWDHGAFDTPKMLTPNAIQKLAAATRNRDCSLLVWVDSDGIPSIWGVSRVREKTTHCKPHSETRLNYYALRIVAQRPGSLVFDNLLGIGAELHEGVVTYRKSVPLSFLLRNEPYRECLVPFLSDAFQSMRRTMNLPTELEFHEKSDFEEVYIYAIREILRAAERHGRGGTLVISRQPAESLQLPGSTFSQAELPHTPTPRSLWTVPLRLGDYFGNLRRCPPSRRIDPGLPAEIQQLYDDPDYVYDDSRSRVCKLYDSFIELEKACECVGNLTAADGAVVLMPDLSVCAIGAKIENATNPSKLHADLDAFKANEFQPYAGTRGTRFGSGVAYANQVPGSLVFIASADGPISACARAGPDNVIITEPLAL